MISSSKEPTQPIVLKTLEKPGVRKWYQILFRKLLKNAKIKTLLYFTLRLCHDCQKAFSDTSIWHFPASLALDDNYRLASSYNPIIGDE